MEENTFNISTEFVKYVHKRTWRIENPKNIQNIVTVESPVFHFKQVTFSWQYKIIISYVKPQLCLQFKYEGEPPVEGYVKLICSCLNNAKKEISTHKEFSHDSLTLPITCDLFKYDFVFLDYTIEFVSPESTIEKNKNVIAKEIQLQETRMIKHISELYLNPEYSDITFYVGDSVFPAHKFILAVHSPVFKRMFLNGMKEQVESKVYIDHFTAEVFSYMLHYMYTRELKDLEAMVNELIFMAHMYDVELLINECVEFLQDNMNAENVLDTLVMANRLDLKYLRELCLDFIARERKSIYSKKEFEDIKEHHQDIALQILDSILDVDQKQTTPVS